MFISCDVNGMVVVNEITSVAFGMCYSDDRILIDPKKFDTTKYQTISTRFYSPKNPSDNIDMDLCTLIALGSIDQVVVYLISKDSMELVYTIERPQRYPSQNMGGVTPFYPRLPCLSFG
jgi:hypothetical protein